MGAMAGAGLGTRARQGATEPAPHYTTAPEERGPSGETSSASLYRYFGERLGMPLSPRESEALATYAVAGDQAMTAARMGIRVTTLKNLLTSAYAKLGVDSSIDAFRAIGWLTIPPDRAIVIEHRHAASLTAARDLRTAIDRFIAAVAVDQALVALPVPEWVG